MKDNHTPGPDIYRVMLQEPGRIFDRKFVQLGDYQRQSDLLGECLDALEVIKSNSLNPAHTMTIIGLQETVDANYKIATAILAKRKGEGDEKE